MEDAVRTAWSLIRLQWEAGHDETETHGHAHGDTIIEMLEANGLADAPPAALALALGLVIAGGTLATSLELVEGVRGGLSPEEARETVRRGLVATHAVPWPDEEDGL